MMLAERPAQPSAIRDQYARGNGEAPPGKHCGPDVWLLCDQVHPASGTGEGAVTTWKTPVRVHSKVLKKLLCAWSVVGCLHDPLQAAGRASADGLTHKRIQTWLAEGADDPSHRTETGSTETHLLLSDNAKLNGEDANSILKERAKQPKRSSQEAASRAKPRAVKAEVPMLVCQWCQLAFGRFRKLPNCSVPACPWSTALAVDTRADVARRIFCRVGEVYLQCRDCYMTFCDTCREEAHCICARRASAVDECCRLCLRRVRRKDRSLRDARQCSPHLIALPKARSMHSCEYVTNGTHERKRGKSCR